MEFFLDDPNIQRLPPDLVSLLSLDVAPYPDGYRLKVRLELTPFEKSPHIDIRLTAPDGSEAGSVSVIEPAAWKMEFTMHVRGSAGLAGQYTLTASLYYPDGLQAEPLEYGFEIPAG